MSVVNIVKMSVLVFSLIIASIVIYFIYKDNQEIMQHREECRKICEPDDIVELFSTEVCVCKEKIDMNKMI